MRVTKRIDSIDEEGRETMRMDGGKLLSADGGSKLRYDKRNQEWNGGYRGRPDSKETKRIE